MDHPGCERENESKSLAAFRQARGRKSLSAVRTRLEKAGILVFGAHGAVFR